MWQLKNQTLNGLLSEDRYSPDLPQEGRLCPCALPSCRGAAYEAPHKVTSCRLCHCALPSCRDAAYGAPHKVTSCRFHHHLKAPHAPMMRRWHQQDALALNAEQKAEFSML